MSIGQFIPIFAPDAGYERDPFAEYVVMDLRFDDVGSTVPVDTSAFANQFISSSVMSTVASPKMMGKGAGLFSGTGNQAQSQAAILRSIPGDFTIEFWQYCTTRKGSDACIIDLRTVTDNYEPYLLVWNAGGLSLNVQNGARMNTAPAPLNQWNHISFGRLGGAWSLYLNGVRVNTNYTNATAFGEGRLTLGTYMDQWNSGAAFHYNGLMDNFRFWNGVSIRGGAATFTLPKAPYAPLPTSSILTGDAQFSAVLNTGSYWGYYRAGNRGTYTGSIMDGYELDIIEANIGNVIAWTGMIATIENKTMAEYLKIASRGAKNGLTLTVADGTESFTLNPPTYNASTGRISFARAGTITTAIGNAIFRQGRLVNITTR